MDVIDLFAGLGGFSEGARMAGAHVRWAANHWPAAVDQHAANHPDTPHVCQDLHQADWSLVPQHDVLLASPACQGHSHARGKERPHHDAQRATAWAVVSALEYHRPPAAIIENVVAFSRWALFPAWCSALSALGYAVSPHVIDAADLGVPQNRVRLFIVCTLSKHSVSLTLPRRAQADAAGIVDFDAGRWSPVQTPRRAARSLARITAGRARFGERFVVPYYANGSGLTGRALDRPIGTITTRARWAVVDGDRMRMLSVDEGRRAMGFPATYRLPAVQATAMKMLGNAVCPPVACELLSALRAAA